MQDLFRLQSSGFISVCLAASRKTKDFRTPQVGNMPTSYKKAPTVDGGDVETTLSTLYAKNDNSHGILYGARFSLSTARVM